MFRPAPLLAFVLLAAPVLPGAAPDAADLAFFEREIRPVLIRRCEECHGAQKQKGGLRLDSAAGWRAGGDGGAVVVPGRPEESPLLAAVRHASEDLQMPPKERLPEAEIAALEEWIRRGAPDPRAETPAGVARARAMSLEQARAHWAFRPVTAPPLPAGEPGLHPVDALLRPKLTAAGLTPAPPADPRTLVRRAYHVLLGLPPTFARAQRLAADPSPEAWARLVDELLARPEYGQRWARHWLDVARYADTTDKSTDSERRLPFAHAYRDWVVEALNRDLSFDRFVREQIAADLLPAEEQPDRRALGLLTVGRRFEGNLDAPELIIDDRIDTVTRGFLGLTVACARCHDHKTDALPTADYYSLAGILGSVEEPLDLPEVGTAPDTPEVAKYRARRTELLAAHERQVDASAASARRRLRDLAAENLRYLVEESPGHRTVEGFIPLDTPRGLLTRGGPPRWRALIARSLERGEKFFALWPVLLALPREGFAEQAARVLAAAAERPAEHDPEVLAALRRQAPTTMHEAADAFGRAIRDALECPEGSALAAMINAPGNALDFDREEIRRDLRRFVSEHELVLRREGEADGKIRTDLTTLEAGAPVTRAPAVVATTPVAARILVRGDRARPGAAVPRRLPRVLAMVDDGDFPDDGRLRLARALASPRNPLTARVIANRVWQHHFGTGLVATADDFGVTGEPPSHPELLDHLAAYLMAHGWSLKALHRHLMTSEAWRQSSAPRTAALAVDPGNRLVWRMSPRRIDFEALRDGLLRVAGRLDLTPGGRGAPLGEEHVRRALYGFTDRFRLPALLRNFDVANPDTSIARRPETTHPLQALYFLNGPFVRAQAEALNRQPEIAEEPDSAARARAIHRRVLWRDPDPAEAALAAAFLGTTPGPADWVRYTHTLMLSNEFSYCD
jgi:mono/diheme cytochrome c family protein